MLNQTGIRNSKASAASASRPIGHRHLGSDIPQGSSFMRWSLMLTSRAAID